MKEDKLKRNADKMGVGVDVYIFLRQSNRKLRYFAHDLKEEKIIVTADSVTFLPSREDSFDRLISLGADFAADEKSVEDTFGLHGGCNAWAFMVSDRIWGENTGYRTHSNIDDIRIGDMVLLLDRVTGEKVHYFVVTSNIEMSTIPGFSYERFKSSDGNMGGKVAWGGYYYMGALKSDYTFTIYTRYPV